MAKIKLTKNELKRQKDSLKRFTRFLPMLQLKKQQLQMEVLKIQRSLRQLNEEIEIFREGLEKWVDVFGEEIGLERFVKIAEIKTSPGNIAGIDVSIFNSIEFEDIQYDFLKTPLWVDYGVKAVKDYISMRIKRESLEKQERLLKEELRVTSQRVNLFEKVKIPETQENIRKLQIYLGDLQTAAVVRGKLAKAKIIHKR